MKSFPQRKAHRLVQYDYSQDGSYFITICTFFRQTLLSEVIEGEGLAPAEIQLTAYGSIAEKQLLALEKRYSHIRIEKYVIMPNHIHAILNIGSSPAGAKPRPTLSDIVCVYKSLTTRQCKQIKPINKLFQDSFYDHVIRSEKEYEEIWQYINDNPEKWAKDRFYISPL